MHNFKTEATFFKAGILGLFLSLVLSLLTMQLLIESLTQSLTPIIFIGIFFTILLFISLFLSYYSGFFYFAPMLVCLFYIFITGIVGVVFAYVNQAWLHLIITLVMYIVLCFYIFSYEYDEQTLKLSVLSGLKANPGIITLARTGNQLSSPWRIKQTNISLIFVPKLNSFFSKNIKIMFILFCTVYLLTFLGHKHYYRNPSSLTEVQAALNFYYFQFYIVPLFASSFAIYRILIHQIMLLRLYEIVKKDKRLKNFKRVKQDYSINENEKIIIYMLLFIIVATSLLFYVPYLLLK